MPVPRIYRASSLFALAACAVFPGIALAADFNPDTKIDAVTVYTRGAEIERLVPLDMPQGDHRVIIDRLPDGIQPDDVRVEGAVNGEMVIQSVDVARVPVTGDPGDMTALRREHEDLRDEKAMLEGRIRTAELQRQMITTLVQPVAAGKDGQAAQVSLSPDALYQFIAERHEDVETRIRAARQAIRRVDRRMDEIDRELSRANGEPEWASRIVVSVSAETASRGDMRLRYRLPQAAWQPVYDARLDTSVDAGKLEITQRASVQQRTGEDWSGVKLTLATVQPQAMTAAPDLNVSYVGFARPMPRSYEAGQLMSDSAVAPAPAMQGAAKRMRNMEEQRSVVTDFGFDALYSVPGVADVPASGDQRLVLIGRQDVTSKMQARIVPSARAAAFLTVRFAHDAPAPLPPGAVRLFRDGVFIGNGRMPLANPGADTELGFGLDKRIEVTRTLVTTQRGEEGIFNRARTDTRDWRTIVTNHHRVPVDIVLLEGLPQPTDDEISVRRLETNDRPDETDVDGKPGVSAWRFSLAPQDTRTLSFGYMVDWPQGREVVVSMR